MGGTLVAVMLSNNWQEINGTEKANRWFNVESCLNFRVSCNQATVKRLISNESL